MEYRLSLKKIREGKGLSQAEVALGALSQSNYSKFENGLIDINSKAFIKILENLDLGLEELLFITNKYNYSKKENIYREFFRAPVNDIYTLKKIKLDCEQYLNEHQDRFITVLHKICISLIFSTKNGDINSAISHVENLLDEFSKKDHLFIKDIYLINSLFFLFPINSAQLTMNYVDKALNNYGDFQSIHLITVNLRLNYCLMLIKHSAEDKALLHLKEILPITKKYRLGVQMGINYIRQGICYRNLNHSTEFDYLKKGLNILEALEESEIIKLMENEISKIKT